MKTGKCWEEFMQVAIWGVGEIVRERVWSKLDSGGYKYRRSEGSADLGGWEWTEGREGTDGRCHNTITNKKYI